MSTQTSDNNKRIAKNTLLLYFRMFYGGDVVVYKPTHIEYVYSVCGKVVLELKVC